MWIWRSLEALPPDNQAVMVVLIRQILKKEKSNSLCKVTERNVISALTGGSSVSTRSRSESVTERCESKGCKKNKKKHSKGKNSVIEKMQKYMMKRGLIDSDMSEQEFEDMLEANDDHDNSDSGESTSAEQKDRSRRKRKKYKVRSSLTPGKA